jgi:hypothetical protein
MNSSDNFVFETAIDKLAGLYEYLGSEAGGRIIFGAVNRGLLLIAALSLVSLAYQIRGLAGSQGQTPALTQLRGFYRDFGIRALAYWPCMFWPLVLIPDYMGDMFLVALPTAAALASAFGAVVGGTAARAAAATALASLVSVDAVHALVYPWDSLLFESLWLVLAFPDLQNVLSQGISSSAVPLPLVAFGARLLVSRLLLGFGLLKFGAAGRGDHHYIRHFLIAQPVVTPAGLALHRALPNWVWRASLIGSEWHAVGR